MTSRLQPETGRSMRQLLLDVAPPWHPSLANYVPGGNLEALAALELMVRGGLPDRFVYLWGEAGSGRTHLLQATVSAAAERGWTARYVDAAASVPDVEVCSGLDLVALDNVEALDADGQLAAFALYNRLREGAGRLLATGRQAPAGLALRPDLATRLGWGLVFQLRPLTDDEKLDLLEQKALDRGFVLSREVGAFLLHRWRRDVPSLLAALAALDAFSLEQRRPLTIPLVKTLFGV